MQITHLDVFAIEIRGWPQRCKAAVSCDAKVLDKVSGDIGRGGLVTTLGAHSCAVSCVQSYEHGRVNDLRTTPNATNEMRAPAEQ